MSGSVPSWGALWGIDQWFSNILSQQSFSFLKIMRTTKSFLFMWVKSVNVYHIWSQSEECLEYLLIHLKIRNSLHVNINNIFYEKNTVRDKRNRERSDTVIHFFLQLFKLSSLIKEASHLYFCIKYTTAYYFG